MARDTIHDIFILCALLIVAAYFAGVATDVNAFGAGIQKIIFAATGQTATGFKAYPKGGPTKIQTF